MPVPRERITYLTSPKVHEDALNELFASAWQGHRKRAFGATLARSLAYICAFDGDRLVGFVNLAWDGGVHGFILDTTVCPDCQRLGIGTELLRQASRIAADAGLEWLHVDYEPHLDHFYRRCGFRPTAAGLMRLP